MGAVLDAICQVRPALSCCHRPVVDDHVLALGAGFTMSAMMQEGLWMDLIARRPFLLAANRPTPAAMMGHFW